MTTQSYRDLAVWQKSMDLAVEIYTLARSFPHDEQYGLTSQMRRAAVSIPTSIAEGHGRVHRAEYLHFLSLARGSLRELETQVQLAVRLDYADKQAARSVWLNLQEVGRMLNGLITSLQAAKLSEDSTDYVLAGEIGDDDDGIRP